MVVNDPASETDDFHDHRSERFDRQVLSGPDVEHLRRRIRRFHQEDAGIGQVVDVEELSPRPAATPDDQLVVAALLGLVGLADQRRQDVARRQVVVSSGP